MIKVSELDKNTFDIFFYTYIDKVSSEYSLIEELEISQHRLIKFVQDIPYDKFDYRYQPDKWTIKEIIQHLMDAERVFVYRALRFSRGDKTELPGYDENLFVENCMANNRHLTELLSEFTSLRQATISFFKSLSKEQLNLKGIASNRNTSVAVLGFSIIGHQNHHLQVYAERYL